MQETGSKYLSQDIIIKHCCITEAPLWQRTLPALCLSALVFRLSLYIHSCSLPLIPRPQVE